MKKTKIGIILLCTASFIAGALVSQPSHIQKMEYALDNVEYWEVDDSGMDLYDYNGNVYRWE